MQARLHVVSVQHARRSANKTIVAALAHAHSSDCSRRLLLSLRAFVSFALLGLGGLEGVLS